MTENSVDTARRTTMPHAQDTLFTSLQRAQGSAPSEKRALAGLRNGDTWVELTFDELMADVETVSAHLAALGLGQGDVLCLVLPNWTEAVIYTYAASRLGAVVCPITTIYRQRELSFILTRTECPIVVVPSVYRGFDFAAMMQGLRASLPRLRHVISVGDTETPGVLPSDAMLNPASARPCSAALVRADDIAILAFTSGTTGEPKGVLHSNASMHAMIDDFVTHAGFGHGLTSLVISPFGHLTGFTWGVLMPLRGAGDVVLLEAWDPRLALDFVARYSVDITMGATPFLSDLLDAAAHRTTDDFPDIYICGGAPIPPSLIERAVQRHRSRVIAVWGMSEYPIGTATSVGDDPAVASRSDGRPCGQADVLIVDDSGAPVRIGEEGDLLIRGPALFKGYYKRPDIDADSMTRGGYLRTGDRARLLDNRGLIRICGRTKDIIIRGGENIPVVEIENIALGHPAVKDIALVPLPHDRLGETACACVVLNPSHSTLTVHELGAFLGQHGMAKQFFPEAVLLMTELPRTPSGKVQKFALRERVLAMRADDAVANAPSGIAPDRTPSEKP